MGGTGDQSTRVGEYRGFDIYNDPDGWYAENDGGTCLGPFDARAQAERAVDASDYKKPSPSWTLRDAPADVWDALTAACERDRLPRRVIVLRALRQYLNLPTDVDLPAPARTPRAILKSS